jgi:hypothetical protein
MDAQAKNVPDHRRRIEWGACCKVLEVCDVRPVMERCIETWMYAVAFVVIDVSDQHAVDGAANLCESGINSLEKSVSTIADQVWESSYIVFSSVK